MQKSCSQPSHGSPVVEVALNLPLRKTFDYRWPDDFPQAPQPGIRVLVPFGNSKRGGMVVRSKPTSEHPRLKSVSEALDEQPALALELLELSRWVAEYYLGSWGEVLHAAMPGGLGMRMETRFWPLQKTLPGYEDLSTPLQKLVPRESWTQKDWQHAQPTVWDETRLEQWLRDGAVRKAHQPAGIKLKPRMERWVRLRPNAAPESPPTKRKTKRIEVLKLLDQTPEWSWKALQTEVSNAGAALRKLAEEGKIEVFERRIFRRFLPQALPEREAYLTLNLAQAEAFAEIDRNLKSRTYQTFLLEGVTGSGKTEVYLHAVRTARKLGKSCLVLVPEIALTPQLVNRFRTRFGDEIAVLHSGMDDGERLDEWSRVRQGLAFIVIGARSAVFAPLENLGLIILDEEHDSSYKQGESPRYHGRDVAIMRGYRCGATVVLGSATPSLESVHNVASGKYTPLTLPERVEQAELPEIRVLDLRNTPRLPGSPFLSEPLLAAMQERLQRREQTILFLNRRGYAPLVLCPDCQHTHTCPHCSLSLVLHQGIGRLRCHQCEFAQPLPSRCPGCRTERPPKIIGVGTEQVESELNLRLPDARILRMDRDTLHGKHALSRMYERIRQHEVDLVIGTQLVTKGHDFPEVTLVGVLLADLGLNLPDFRASERTFQLLTQVSGRAGRGTKPGEVIIQSYNPRHHSVLCAQAHDPVSFRKLELARRDELRLPPYQHLALVVCASPDEWRAKGLADQLAARLSASNPSVRWSGPTEAPLRKLRSRYRVQLLLRAARPSLLRQALKRLLEPELSLRRNEQVTVDVDPVDLL